MAEKHNLIKVLMEYSLRTCWDNLSPMEEPKMFLRAWTSMRCSLSAAVMILVMFALVPLGRAQGSPNILWQNTLSAYSIEQTVISCDGAYVGVVSRGINGYCNASLYRATDGSLVRTDDQPSGHMRLAFSPDNIHYAESKGSTVEVKRISDGSTVRWIPSGSLNWPVTAIDYSPNGSLLAIGTYDSIFEVRRVLDGTVVSFGPAVPWGGAINCVKFSPNGSSITISSQGSFNSDAWLIRSGASQAIHLYDYYSSWVHNNADSPPIAYNRNGSEVGVGFNDGTIHLFDSFAGAPLFSVAADSTRATSLAFSSDGSTFLASSESHIRVWGAKDWLLRVLYDQETLPKVTTLDVSRSGPELVYSCSDWTFGPKLTYATNPASPSKLLSLTFDPTPVRGYGVTVNATVRPYGRFTNVALRASGITPISMTLGLDNLWHTSFSSNLLGAVRLGLIPFTATGTLADGRLSSVQGLLRFSNQVYDYPGSILTLTARDSGENTHVVDGMTCDNSSAIENPEKLNRIVIPIPQDVSDITAGNCRVSISDGSGQTDTESTGHAEYSIVEGIPSLVYYPPNEFNPNQAPSSFADLRESPIRTVFLSVTWTRNGRAAHINDCMIYLARPVVMLVHGINNGPMNWRTNAELGSESGFYDSKVKMPLVAVDHGDVQGGRGPVELGALRLSKSIAVSLSQLFDGYFDPSFPTDWDGLRKVRAYDFHFYRGIRLASRRVDVVAWSYGSMVTRWYLKSPLQVSAEPDRGYRWLDCPFDPLWYTSYRGDVRKVITLGGMWRGVPLCNYLNEANFTQGPASMNEAPAPDVPFGPHNLGGWIDNVLDDIDKLNSKKPAIEVMAVESPWGKALTYNGQGSMPTPFLAEVQYGSVAGDDQRYQAWGITVGDPYRFVDQHQSPTWFPYLQWESGAVNSRGWHDGIVPVWSAAIPGSYKIVPVDHSNLGKCREAVEYCAQWLSSKDLPNGTRLNSAWVDPNFENVIVNADGTKAWYFEPEHMAPYPQQDIYSEVGSEGRLDQSAFGSHGPLLGCDVVSAQRVGDFVDVYIKPTLGSLTLATGVQLESAELVNGTTSELGDRQPAYFGTIRYGSAITSRLRFDGSIGPPDTTCTLRIRLSYLYPWITTTEVSETIILP